MTQARTTESKADAKISNDSSITLNAPLTEKKVFFMALPPNCKGCHELQSSSKDSIFLYKDSDGFYFYVVSNQIYYLKNSILPARIKNMLANTPFDQLAENPRPCVEEALSEAIIFQLVYSNQPGVNLYFFMPMPPDGKYVKSHHAIYLHKEGPQAYFCYALGEKIYLNPHMLPKYEKEILENQSGLDPHPCVLPRMYEVIKNSFYESFSKSIPFPFFSSSQTLDSPLKTAVEDNAAFLVRMMLVKASGCLSDLFPNSIILAEVTKFQRDLLEIIYHYLFDEIENQMTELYNLAHEKKHYEIASMLSENTRFNVSLTPSLPVHADVICNLFQRNQLRYAMQCLSHLNPMPLNTSKRADLARCILDSRDIQGNNALMYLDHKSDHVETVVTTIQDLLQKEFKQLLIAENKKGETPYLRMARMLHTADLKLFNVLALLPKLLPPPTIDYLKMICDELITSRRYNELAHLLQSWHGSPLTQNFITDHLREILGSHVPQLGLLYPVLHDLYFFNENICIYLAQAGVPFDWRDPQQRNFIEVLMDKMGKEIFVYGAAKLSQIYFAKEFKGSIESVYDSLLKMTKSKPILVARFLQAWYELERIGTFPKSQLWNREAISEVRLFPDSGSSQNNDQRMRDVIQCIIADHLDPACLADAAFWRVKTDEDFNFLLFCLKKQYEYPSQVLKLLARTPLPSDEKGNEGLSKIGYRLPLVVCLGRDKVTKELHPSMFDFIDSIEPRFYSYKYAEWGIICLYGICVREDKPNIKENRILEKILTNLFDNKEIDHLFLFVECVLIKNKLSSKPCPYQIAEKLLMKGVISTPEQFSSALKLVRDSAIRDSIPVHEALPRFAVKFLCYSPVCSKELLLGMLSALPNLLVHFIDYSIYEDVHFIDYSVYNDVQFAFDYFFKQLQKHLSENELFDVFNKPIHGLFRFIEYAESKSKKDIAEKIRKALPKLASTEAKSDTTFNLLTFLNSSTAATQGNDDSTFNFGSNSFESASQTNSTLTDTTFNFPISFDNSAAASQENVDETFNFGSTSFGSANQTSPMQTFSFLNSSNPFSSTSNSTSELSSSTSNPFSNSSNNTSELFSSTSSNFTFAQ